MSSYFVDPLANASGSHHVHDRSRCPPSCFAPAAPAEYLGDFLDTGQAMCVARLRYRHVLGCAWCGGEGSSQEACARSGAGS